MSFSDRKMRVCPGCGYKVTSKQVSQSEFDIDEDGVFWHEDCAEDDSE